MNLKSKIKKPLIPKGRAVARGTTLFDDALNKRIIYLSRTIILALD